MSSKPRLVYFNFPGKGELIRLVLRAAGVDFEDDRVDLAVWPSRKAEAPDGLLPYMEIEGKKYPESRALTRYLAKKYNLAGKDDLEVFLADIILCKVDDFRNAYVRFKFDPILTQEQKTTLIEKFIKEKCPAHYERLEKILSQSRSGFLVGNNLTMADLAVVDAGDQVEEQIPGIIDKYPEVKEHRQKIKGLPILAAHFTKQQRSDIGGLSAPRPTKQGLL